jgi:hypothetical protein
MPNATVRADAQALPEATKSTPAAPDSPEATPKDEYLRLMAAKIVADVRLEKATEKRKEEAAKAEAAKAEVPKLEASRAFAQAYHAWLVAKADTENPSVEEEEAERFSAALPAAERRLMVTPSAYPDQLWQKLEAFEAILGDEIMIGPRRDSVILLALASIKQDMVNMELLEAAR